MLIRSASIPKDLIFCAAQGFGAGFVLNAARRTQVINPVHAAVAFAAIAGLEKVFGWLSRRVIPGSEAMFGPIPIGVKKLVSYGLAIGTTWKVMQLAGVVSSMPWAITAWGALSAGALVLGGVKVAIEKAFPQSLEDQLRAHAQSKSFSNRKFTFEHNGKPYEVRVIANPEKRDVNILAGLGGVRMMDSRPYIIGHEGDLPEEIRHTLDSIFPKASYKNNPNINGCSELEWMAVAK